jgi:hypothetical protein
VQQSPLIVLLNGQVAPLVACDAEGLRRWAKENGAVAVRKSHVSLLPFIMLIADFPFCS